MNKSKNKNMIRLFVASEAFFFLALIIAYVYYSHPNGNLSDSAKYLDITKTAIFTFFLLSSSLTIAFAHRKLNDQNKKSVLIFLLGTIILGIVFLAGQGMEYARLINMDVSISKNVFGSAFFTLTGFHGLHVFIGLIVLSIMSFLIYKEKLKDDNKYVFGSAAVYWHFVDAVWVVVFSVVYIGAVI